MYWLHITRKDTDEWIHFLDNMEKNRENYFSVCTNLRKPLFYYLAFFLRMYTDFKCIYLYAFSIYIYIYIYIFVTPHRRPKTGNHSQLKYYNEKFCSKIPKRWPCPIEAGSTVVDRSSINQSVVHRLRFDW